jgi:hypothetical protein
MNVRVSAYAGMIASSIALAIVGGCARKVLKSDLVGDYVVDYPYGRETQSLSADGKYIQNFSRKERLAKLGRPQVHGIPMVNI